MLKNEKCGTCFYSRPLGLGEFIHDGRAGISCRRYPHGIFAKPSMDVPSTQIKWCTFPTMGTESWCGEWKAMAVPDDGGEK